MLPSASPHRLLFNPLRRPLAASAVPHVCACDCGARFRSFSSTSAPLRTADTRLHTRNALAITLPFTARRPSMTRTQRGYASTRRRSPSTFKRDERMKSKGLSAAEAEQDRRSKEEINQLKRGMLHEYFQRDFNVGLTAVPPETSLAYLDDVIATIKSSPRSDTLDPRRFSDVLDRHDLSFKDQYRIARILLNVHGVDPQLALSGKLLLYALSNAGCPEATFLIVSQATDAAKRNPEILSMKSIAFARQHLTRLANEGQNYRAMVLEGKVAHRLGKEDRAIELWTAAMGAAVTEAEVTAREGQTDEEKSLRAMDDDNLQLSSPWIELYIVHSHRAKRFATKGNDLASSVEGNKCEWAMEVGCKLDDPDSHFQRADWHRDLYNTYSPYLYHLLKAAASFHWKAAHELADFYATSEWPYLDDEPPDHVKPTPFDTYPAPTTSKSFGTSVRQFLGWDAIGDLSPEEHMFRSAAYPNTAQERFVLALYWLNLPMAVGYAPSFLLKAQLLLQEHLSAKANAPKAALELSDERYRYASREDKEANNPIREESQSRGEDPRNPWYDLSGAKDCILEVFYAYEAHKLAQKTLENYAMQRKKKAVNEVVDEDELVHERNFKNSKPDWLRKWLRNPDVREKYVDDIEKLIRSARNICDEMGWDMYDPDNALLYKARL